MPRSAAADKRVARAKLPKFRRRKPGQPTLYQQDAHCARATKLALLGLTDLEIAEQFGVDESTLNDWKARHPEFATSLYEGRTGADADIAHSLYRRAKGFERPAVKIFPGNADSGPIYAPYQEYYPPDVGAAKLWLTNRRGHSWKERQEVNHMGSLEHRISLMTPDERRARLVELRERARLTIEGEATEVDEDRGS